MQSKLLLSALMMCSLMCSAQRAVRWTVGVNSPVITNAKTPFSHIGVGLKASYERFRNVELGLGLHFQGFNKTSEIDVTDNHYLTNALRNALPSKVEYASAHGAFVVELNGTYRWNPENTVSPMAGISAGVANNAPARRNFDTGSEWNAFVAPHVGVMLWRHIDARFSYYLTPHGYSRGMLSVGYKF